MSAPISAGFTDSGFTSARGRWNDFAFRLLRASLVGSFSFGLLGGRQFVFDLLDVGRSLRVHIREFAELCGQVAVKLFRRSP